jgi:hypothetical protein
MQFKHFFTISNMLVMLILLMMGRGHKGGEEIEFPEDDEDEEEEEEEKPSKSESQNSQINLPKDQQVEEYEVKVSPESDKSNEVTQGGKAKYKVQVIPKHGFKGNVELSVDKSIKKNIKTTFNKMTVKPGDNDITLTIDTSTSSKSLKKSYDFKVNGKSKRLTRRGAGKLKVKS